MKADIEHCFGALALELAPNTLASNLAMDQPHAAELAVLVAADLSRFVPAHAPLQLALLGAHVDPVELLRPGWPLHRTLAELAVRAPGERDGARVVAFGCHERKLPGPLTPDADLVGGPLRVLPWVLSGPRALMAPVAEQLEADLLETGMAGAATALVAQQRFGAKVEHARYLTLHDLVAMMALQYEHAGLAELWPLIEASLFEPDAERVIDAPPEPLLRMADAKVRMAMLDIDAWADAGLAPEHTTPDHLAGNYDAFCMRQRQFEALLGAHRIIVEPIPCRIGTDPRDLLRM
jgi:hypothetical protein